MDLSISTERASAPAVHRRSGVGAASWRRIHATDKEAR